MTFKGFIEVLGIILVYVFSGYLSLYYAVEFGWMAANLFPAANIVVGFWPFWTVITASSLIIYKREKKAPLTQGVKTFNDEKPFMFDNLGYIKNPKLRKEVEKAEEERRKKSFSGAMNTGPG